MGPSPSSTSQPSSVNGGTCGVDQWWDLGVHRGFRQRLSAIVFELLFVHLVALVILRAISAGLPTVLDEGSELLDATLDTRYVNTTRLVGATPIGWSSWNSRTR
jgi:hypothetical protein